MKPRSPLAWALLAGLAVLAAAFAPVLWQMWRPAPAVPAGGLGPPWQIERLAPGQWRAFGLQLPGSTVADAQRIWGDELQVALIASGTQPAALEAYVERWQGGGVGGRLVLATDVPSSTIARWLERSPRREVIDAQARRWSLHADDRAEALRAPVNGLSFLPAGRIDAATLQARFGTADETLVGAGGQRHWFYPQRGLVMSWDESSGRAVIQMVAASEFEARLRAPLVAEAAAARASAAMPAVNRQR